jgi:uncharacterized protein (DUF488 family)
VTTTIFSIGYERAGFPAFLAALEEARIEAIVDVRDLPNSRRAGFAKTMLTNNLATAGIEYVPMKALGTPKAGRLAHRAGDKETFWEIVDDALARPEARLAIEHVALLAKSKRACLMCFEHDWRDCHRARVCELLAETHGIEAVHLAP